MSNPHQTDPNPSDGIVLFMVLLWICYAVYGIIVHLRHAKIDKEAEKLGDKAFRERHEEDGRRAETAEREIGGKVLPGGWKGGWIITGAISLFFLKYDPKKTLYATLYANIRGICPSVSH
jgi:hypothetical protein